MSEIKYLTVCSRLTQSMKDCLDEVPRRGGFFNWLFAFKGEISAFNDVDDFNKYDIIHINGSPNDQILASEVRRRINKDNKRTKIVLNNDHVHEIWPQWNMPFQRYYDAQRQADMVFGTEQYQTSNLIEGAKCIPHPHWIHMLKRWGRKNVNDSIGYLFHWWEGNTMTPGIWSYKLREQGIKHRSKLYAYMPDRDKFPNWTKVYFDDLISPMAYPQFIESIIQNKIVVDYCGYHTYGRTSVDMAAIGVPMVGSNRIDSMRRCFPFTSHDPYDTKAMVESIKKLWTDEAFYKKVVDYAKEACEYYNYKNSKERFLKALKETEEEKKNE